VSTIDTQASDEDDRRFAILGVILQALHVLFGVTAILGMYLTLARMPKVNSALWREHYRWQLATFWAGAALYAVTVFIGWKFGQWWPFVLAAMWVSYRIFSSAIGVATRKPIPRLY